MNGLIELNEILANLEPEADGDDYVFCSIGDEEFSAAPGLQAFASIREREGITLVMERRLAERAGFRFEGSYRKISLRVHSSLQAVGLTAAMSTTLARRGISANVIAGYYHDHVFVPAERAGEALQAIQELSCVED